MGNSLIFLAIPVVFNFGVLRRDPALQPYAQAPLRHNGQQLVEFVSFTDVPRDVTQPGGKPGFIASGVIRVRESARYEIHPMRFKGEIPIRVLSIGRERNTQVEWRDLQEGRATISNTLLKSRRSRRVLIVHPFPGRCSGR